VSDASRLRGNIGHFQYLALGFGTMIGSAWVILLGDWLGKAGPGGAVLGFLGGTVIMMAIGMCYAELTARLPEAGSEFIYAHRVYGRGLAFTVGWFLILYFVSVTIFEALALAWIVDILVPSWKSATLYTAFGTPISAATLSVGIAGAALIYGLNFRGAHVAVVSHSILTYGFLAVVLCILGALLVAGHPGHLMPLFATTNGKPWWLGSGAIFAFCAYALNGFQAIPQAIEERSGGISLRAIGFTIVGSIAAAALFYCLAVTAASAIVPWRSLVSEPLPMAAAAAALPHGEAVVTILLVATAASLLKAWNGVFMMAVRLLVAMARAGYVPATLMRLHPRFRSPVMALVLIGSLNIGGIFLGKGAIEPITDMCAMVLTLTYVLCCATVLKMRGQGAAAHFQVPGGQSVVWFAAAGAGLMAAVAFATPFWEQSGIPLEWRLLGAWSAIGVVVWFYHVRHARLS
jgi:APA family basic amino acid/polyamine antiporter